MRSSRTAAAQPERNGHRWRAAPYAVLVAALGASLGLSVAPAQAASFVVQNLDDAGVGSLRAMIDAANASSGPDVITFQAGLTGTITLTTGELVVSEGVTIAGPGSGQLTVNAGGLSRVFDIHADTPGASAVTLSGLTLANGMAPPDPAPVNPGDLDEGGAILATSAGAGALTLSDVVVSGSTGGAGGGVLVRRLAVTITNSTFSGNTAGFDGGAIRGFTSNVSITDSTISGNTAALTGGGIRVSAGSLSLLRTAVSGNTAAQAGGVRAATGATASVDSSRISGNTASGATGITGNGGGIMLDDLAAGSSSIRNSLISGNTAAVNAGGIDIGTGAVSVSNVTVVDNSAGNEGGGIRFNGGTTTMTGATVTGNTANHGGGVLSTGPGATVRSSILAGNTSTGDASERDLTLRTLPGDGPVHLDYSLVQTAPPAGAFTAPTPGSDLLGQDPQLAALGDNGGPTQTRRPLNGSPVLDHGRSFGLAQDQRGRFRPVDLAGVANAAGGDGADMGAFELSSTSGATAVQNLAAPTVAGSARLGATMTATSSGSWNPVNATLSRQWLRNGAAIPGATGASYTVAGADVGKSISLRVTGSMPGFTSTSATSTASATVSAGTLVLSGTPRISGRTKVGKTLTAVPPTARPAASVRYQWLRSGKAIRGATKATYKLRKADARKRMSVKVTYVRSGYVPKVVLIRKAGTVRK
ncbi:choice-of-anchor Q domain-containing protein [Marmoricola sp. RAF53]|uniref:choice-of-anchor Q domain-containing protein n=1 Tax=Marmoricola sp. RAF53 TaxID=3233059 RepID=UPI003F95FB6C